MRKSIFYCAGNWKLNKGPEQTRQFFTEFSNQVRSDEITKMAVFLPALTLHLVPESLRRSGLMWGGQNVFWETEGAFTGENSGQVLKEMGATHCLVGHSERRALFAETNSHTQKKMQLLAKVGLTPILCVGETLDQRKVGSTNDIICAQLEEALVGWKASDSFWLAYEPVWAIGTGEVASPEQAEAAHVALRNKLKTLLPDQADHVPILYGGSVKPDNAAELALKPNVDGFLIGGASLKVDSFLEILRHGQKSKKLT